jgi:hypothetical protein
MPCWMQYCRSSSSLVDGVLVGRGGRGLAVRVVVRVGFGVADVVRSVDLVAVGLRVGRSVDRSVGRRLSWLGTGIVGTPAGVAVVRGTAAVAELTATVDDAEACR